MNKLTAGILQPTLLTRSVFQSPSWPRGKKVTDTKLGKQSPVTAKRNWHFGFNYWKKKSTRFVSHSYCNAQTVAAISKDLPSQRPHNINPAPSTACHCLHLPLLPPLVTLTSPFYVLLQLLFTTAKAEASCSSSPFQHPLPKARNKGRFAPLFLHYLVKRPCKQRVWSSSEPSSSSAFLPPPAHSDCVILFLSPGSCIAAIAVEQKTRLALYWN